MSREGEGQWSTVDPRYNLAFIKPSFGVFCAGVRYNVSEEEIRELFSKYGRVISAWIPLLRGGKKSGNAIVIYAKEAEAKSAIAGLNDTEFQGRKIKVEEYHPRPIAEPSMRQDSQEARPAQAIDKDSAILPEANQNAGSQQHDAANDNRSEAR